MKRAFLILFALVIVSIFNTMSQSDKDFEVLEANPKSLFSIIPVGMGIWVDNQTEKNYLEASIGVIYQRFVNEKIRIDLHAVANFSVSDGEKTGYADDELYLRPNIRIQYNHPILYSNKSSTIKVLKYRPTSYNRYTQQYYFNVPTSRKMFLNAYGGFYNCYWDRRVMFGINASYISSARISYNGGLNKSFAIAYYEIGFELAYAVDINDNLMALYTGSNLDPKRFGWTSYVTFHRPLNKGFGGRIELGNVLGVWAVFSLLINIPT